MNSILRRAFENEMSLAKKEYMASSYKGCFEHLERAHILGQSYIIPHTLSHWWMLKVGFKTRDFREIFGQLTRIIASIIFSRIWVPIGNTGGANVSPIKPMKIPQDLQAYLDQK
jgi:hypothetical protein